MNFLQPFEKFIAWVAGSVSGKKSAQSVDNDATNLNNQPVTQLFNQIILAGASSAIGTMKNITPAEAAVVQDVMQGVKPAADPFTYANALLSAVGTIPAKELSPTLIPLAQLVIEAATATYVAAHPNPAALLAPATIVAPAALEQLQRQNENDDSSKQEEVPFDVQEDKSDSKPEVLSTPFTTGVTQ